MSKQYNNGARFERQVRAKLEDMGLLVIRSAGSKSKVDLVAVLENGETWLVQCKANGVFPAKERREFWALAKKYKCTPIFAYRNKGIVLEEVGVED